MKNIQYTDYMFFLLAVMYLLDTDFNEMTGVTWAAVIAIGLWLVLTISRLILRKRPK